MHNHRGIRRIKNALMMMMTMMMMMMILNNHLPKRAHSFCVKCSNGECRDFCTFCRFPSILSTLAVASLSVLGCCCCCCCILNKTKSPGRGAGTKARGNCWWCPLLLSWDLLVLSVTVMGPTGGVVRYFCHGTYWCCP